jgi:hypothetical protein
LDVALVEASGQAALALGELSAYLGVHSKSLGGRRGLASSLLIKPRKKPGISSFFRVIPAKRLLSVLVQGLALPYRKAALASDRVWVPGRTQ